MQRELEVAVDAVAAACRVCRMVQSDIPESLDKRDRSPVTVADFASQAVICRALGEAFPSDPIIAEEDSALLRSPEGAPFPDRIVAALVATGLNASPGDVCDWIDRGRTDAFQPRFWTLDPIDGTKGFLRGEQYAVSLALIVGGEIRVAVLGCPNLSVETGGDARGVLFAAMRGEGAYSMPLDGGGPRRPVRVRETADPARAVVCESVESGHSDHGQSSRIAALLGIMTNPVRMDSQAKYAAVARGEADIYLRLPTRADYREKIWDHAGGALVVEEAGGCVIDVDGRPLEWTHGRTLAANRGVIVTHPALRAPVLRAVVTALSGDDERILNERLRSLGYL